MADVFGAAPSYSFWGGFERMEGYVTLLHLFGYFLAAAALLEDVSVRRRFLRAALVASMAMAAYCLLQLMGLAPVGGYHFSLAYENTRLDGTFGSPSYLAPFFLFNVFFAFLLAAGGDVRGWIRFYRLAGTDRPAGDPDPRRVAGASGGRAGHRRPSHDHRDAAGAAAGSPRHGGALCGPLADRRYRRGELSVKFPRPALRGGLALGQRH